MFDVKTDFVPDVIAETIPDAVADGVTTTLSRTRRLLRSASWRSGSGMTTRRWWTLAVTAGVISAVVAIWITRRSNDGGASNATDSDPVVTTAPRRVA